MQHLNAFVYTRLDDLKIKQNRFSKIYQVIGLKEKEMAKILL